MSGRLGIDDISPTVSGGRYPAKAVIGENLPVTATVWREGHEAVAATLVWRGPGDKQARQTRMRPVGVGLDRFTAPMIPDREGQWSFRVEAWGDPWTTWKHTVEAKLAAGQTASELDNDLELGARLLERVGKRPSRGDERSLLLGAAQALRDRARPVTERTAPALAVAVGEVMDAHPVRELVTRGKSYKVYADRERALFGAWYEFFPRSTGGRDAAGRPVHGTFETATAELDRVAAMGFDVVYLPPVHPIGRVNRKGPNNSLVAGPDDVGSPWAIGSAEGGHDAIHPELGTLADFKGFVDRAHDLGMEVALDFALQCAPDHPWVTEHPEWFTTRPDGTIAHAENPPKKYQDIYPLNFDNDPRGLFAEVYRVLKHWIEHGVRVFRVDNPHTKPPDFWHELIWKVKDTYPDVLFLSEAFTRPARLYGLGRLGFTQSYTYFTWRTSKRELTGFGEECAARCAEVRPNLFVNTPDILHESLQQGPRAVFALRAALAATLSPSWGVYSGYELFEHQAVRAGSEEYLDSEKYELRPRDYGPARVTGDSLEPWIATLNQIRRSHSALRQLRTLRFHRIDNEALIAYSKSDPATGDAVLVVINLDPWRAQEGMLYPDLDALGVSGGSFTVRDEVTGAIFDWGACNYIRLDPTFAVAHIAAVQRP